MKTYARVTVDPLGSRVDEYNLWRGFAAEKLPPVSPDVLDGIMAPIMTHFDDVVTGGNKDHTAWLLDYMAVILQRPDHKTQVAISLFGMQGAPLLNLSFSVQI